MVTAFASWLMVPELASYAVDIPDKRGVSGQKPEKPGFLTQQNEWQTYEDLERTRAIDPSKFFNLTL